jgi:hypothetical protein
MNSKLYEKKGIELEDTEGDAHTEGEGHVSPEGEGERDELLRLDVGRMEK